MKVWWKGHWRTRKGRFGKVVKWDPYAGRKWGELRVLNSGMSFYLSPKGNQDPDIMEETLNLLILMSFTCWKKVPRYPSEPHSGLLCSFPILPWSRRLTVRQRRNPPTVGHPPSILFFWTLLWGLTSSPQTLELKGAPTIPWFLILTLLMTADHILVRGYGQRGHSRVSCFAPVHECLLGSRQGGSWAKTKGKVSCLAALYWDH